MKAEIRYVDVSGFSKKGKPQIWSMRDAAKNAKPGIKYNVSVQLKSRYNKLQTFVQFVE